MESERASIRSSSTQTATKPDQSGYAREPLGALTPTSPPFEPLTTLPKSKAAAGEASCCF
ncbi:MAG: hypothetical protein H7Z11_19980 [Verrucomicrobia bacterium]|nr:hypothetical protein [Leptolyngbya sp. ES-bin-22]